MRNDSLKKTLHIENCSDFIKEVNHHFMKNIFFYLIFLSACIFTSCRKESNKPKNNTLVVLYPDGNTIGTGLPGSSINGGSVDEFYITASGLTDCKTYKLLSSNFRFTFNVTQGIPPTIVFDSTGINQGIKMFIVDSNGITWTATQGTAKVELYYTDPDKCPEFGKVTFNYVAFTNSAVNHDTLWASGNVNAYY